MANLDDLEHKSITEMSNDEALELLRQVRLSRRVPNKQSRSKPKRSKTTVPAVSADVAAELLKILGG